MNEACSTHGGEMFGKPDRKSPIRIPRHRWKDRIEMVIRIIWLEGIDWIYLAENKDLWLM